jgi:hypothetical protein
LNSLLQKEYITEEEQDTLKNGEKSPSTWTFPQIIMRIKIKTHKEND